jgi:hypothetical protein
MNQPTQPPGGPTALVVVRPAPTGQHTAEVVGLPELRATAPTRDEAVRQVEVRLAEWFASGQLVAVRVPHENSPLRWFGWAKDDPTYPAYIEELERARREDLEQTLREIDGECSGTSSTPTT